MEWSCKCVNSIEHVEIYLDPSNLLSGLLQGRTLSGFTRKPEVSDVIVRFLGNWCMKSSIGDNHWIELVELYLGMQLWPFGLTYERMAMDFVGETWIWTRISPFGEDPSIESSCKGIHWIELVELYLGIQLWPFGLTYERMATGVSENCCFFTYFSAVF